MWSRRSTTSTRRPQELARRSATMLPAKPAPTTSTSGVSRVKPGVMVTFSKSSSVSHPAARHEVRDRAEQDLHVAPQRPVGDVQVVDLYHLLERYPGRSEDLPVPRHPGHQVKAAAVPALHLVVLVDDQRPRPDQAHLAAQDVDELWQLVQR